MISSFFNKKIVFCFSRLIDIVLVIPVFISAFILKFVRLFGLQRLSMSKKALLSVGVMPIRDHYYEPYFNPRDLRTSLNKVRKLPGINWNENEQVKLLQSLHYADEFSSVLSAQPTDLGFHFGNGAFESGDAEFWYSIIRHFKPKKIIEIGSGNSTKIAVQALKMNKKENSTYSCQHICIEPYEMPFLEKMEVQVIREKVESVNKSLFKSLGDNDILFIDSTHMIRPQGDVLFEYLELLPLLNKGVIVHVHDIFTPRDYPEEWLVDKIRFWNEQYLLEAFLTHNTDWKVLAGLNFLFHKHYRLLKKQCFYLHRNRNPGSFYMQRV